MPAPCGWQACLEFLRAGRETSEPAKKQTRCDLPGGDARAAGCYRMDHHVFTRPEPGILLDLAARQTLEIAAAHGAGILPAYARRTQTPGAVRRSAAPEVRAGHGARRGPVVRAKRRLRALRRRRN